MNTMEALEIYDSVNDKRLTIYVTKQVAEKCRTDNDFAQDLFNKIQDQNVEEGSAIEVETIKTEPDIEDYIVEDRADKEIWNRRATIKFLKLYKKYKSKFNTCKKKEVWSMIVKDLSQFNIHKSPEKCAEKWKNLLRTYKTINESDVVTTRFQYYEEIKNILNNTDFNISEDESDNDDLEDKLYLDSDSSVREHWTKLETLKLIKAYQKYKNIKNTFDNNNQFWEVISTELGNDKIVKTPEKCLIKWKNLMRSYKKNVEKGSSITKFPYFHQVKEVVNDDELSQAESVNTLDDIDLEKMLEPEDSKYFPEDESGVKESVSWRASETLKLIKAYKAHKHRFGLSPTKKYVWAIIAADLAKEGIDRDPEKCENKWKSLLRTYRKGTMHGESTRFYFYDEISDALNGSTPFNEDEVSTTQNDTSVINKKMKHNDSDSTYYPDEESEEENDNAGYEQIIIETEPAKTDEENTDIWNFRDTSALIKAYAAYKNSQNRNELWRNISEELEKSNIQRTAENCQRKWANMYRTYKAHKLSNNGAGKFSFFKEMDNVLKEDFRSDMISKALLDDSNEDVNGITESKKCKCMERREIQKQKRHIERMQLLKRKLDVEERKVEAFEKYVKHLRANS